MEILQSATENELTIKMSVIESIKLLFGKCITLHDNQHWIHTINVTRR